MKCLMKNTDGSNVPVDGKLMDKETKVEIEHMELKTFRTPVWRICPVCGENIIFEKIERIKNGKKVSEEMVRKSDHYVKKCIGKILTQRLLDAGWTDTNNTCSQCEHFFLKWYCDGDTVTYCTNPKFTFKKTDRIVEFQDEMENSTEYICKPKTYKPARTIYAWTYEDGTCEEFERKK